MGNLSTPIKMRRVTRKDVAARAGVSTAVVSYVLNDGPRPVSPTTRQRVEQAIRELNYFPNELARGLRTQQTLTIGLIIPNLANPIHAEIAISLQSTCIEQGYLVLLCHSRHDPEQERRYVQMLRVKHVDGVIINPSQPPLPLIEPLLQAGIHTVVLQHDLTEIPCIAADDLLGGRLAAKHLLGLGHRRIALIRRTPGSATSIRRHEGYRQVLAEAGIPYDPALVVESGPGLVAGYGAMQILLALPDPPTAVIAHNDLLALGAMHAIRAAGLGIPGDVSVVGYDDTATSAYLEPPLTTVKFPAEEMGREAAQLLLRLVQHTVSEPLRPLILPIELVVRASTAPPHTNR